MKQNSEELSKAKRVLNEKLTALRKSADILKQIQEQIDVINNNLNDAVRKHNIAAKELADASKNRTDESKNMERAKDNVENAEKKLS